MNDHMKPHLVNRSWLDDPALVKLFAALNRDGEEVRIVGGAVRDALLGEVMGDIDCATTALPDRVIALAKAAGFKAIPTGIEHGTVTVVVDGTAFEVTTLRVDVETDGRHAVVKFGRDWEEDAKRRDFTMNALSIDADGVVHDPLDGYKDLVHREVRFMGDAETRIEEDYLRLLRFFRFFAWYGSGRPERDGLKAAVRTKSGLAHLSPERVWTELKKLLSAPDPERAVLWMRTTEVLNEVLPENWGLDQFHWMITAEREQGWNVDPLRRLQAMLRPADDVVNALATRLKFSNEERGRLVNWTRQSALAAQYVDLSVFDFAKVLYRENSLAVIDALAHELAKRLAKDDDGVDRAAALIEFANSWQRPQIPVSGNDLKAHGFEAGRSLGVKLQELEDHWVEGGFKASKAELLKLL